MVIVALNVAKNVGGMKVRVTIHNFLFPAAHSLLEQHEGAQGHITVLVVSQQHLPGRMASRKRKKSIGYAALKIYIQPPSSWISSL